MTVTPFIHTLCHWRNPLYRIENFINTYFLQFHFLMGGGFIGEIIGRTKKIQNIGFVLGGISGLFICYTFPKIYSFLSYYLWCTLGGNIIVTTVTGILFLFFLCPYKI